MPARASPMVEANGRAELVDPARLEGLGSAQNLD